MNPSFYTILATTPVIFALGYFLHHKLSKAACLVGLLLGAISLPFTLLYALYYLHLFDNWTGIYQLRSLPCSELFVIPSAFLFGFTAAKLNCIIRTLLITGTFAFLITVSYVKMILFPLKYNRLQNKWKKNVCMQTASTTCGAASTATILKQFGIERTETDVARNSFTTTRSTENWYMTRYIRECGLKAEYLQLKTIDQSTKIPSPAIAGVKFGAAGHFIAIISEKDGIYQVGDPIVGPRSYTSEKLKKRYNFTGFFIKVGR